MHTHTMHTHTHTQTHACTHTTHTRAHHMHTHAHTHTQLVDDWNIDAPSYSFSKLDLEKEETRKLVNEYLLWTGDFEGRGPEPVDGKIFK